MLPFKEQWDEGVHDNLQNNNLRRLRRGPKDQCLHTIMNSWSSLLSLSCLSPSLPYMVLVKILGRPCSVASHHILSYLAELVEFHGNCSLAVWAGVVPVLIKIVDSAEGEGLARTSLAILLLLSKHGEGMTTIRNTDGVVSLLVDVLGGRCILSKEGATELLVCLFDENEGCMRDAARLTKFSSLLADISIRGSAKARETANLLMKKVTDDDVTPGDHSHNNNILPSFFPSAVSYEK